MGDAHTYHCPVSFTLHLIGGKYKALILWHLTDRTIRFSQLQKLVSGATPKMLTQQLRELEKNGLITRKVYPVVPPKTEYSLTDKGRSLRPILQAMFSWGMHRLQEEGIQPNCTMMEAEIPCHCQEPTPPPKAMPSSPSPRSHAPFHNTPLNNGQGKEPST